MGRQFYLTRAWGFLLALLTTVIPLFAAGEEDIPRKPKRGVVTASALHFRSEPNKESASLGTNPKGTALSIYSEKNGWYKIDSSAEKWSHGGYIQVTEWEEEKPAQLEPPKVGNPKEIHGDVKSTLKTNTIGLSAPLAHEELSKSSRK